MIPRRVYEHVKAHNWFAVAVDFVIVVVGVFIGIQVSNWNETRTEAAQERDILVGLARDLRSDRAELQTGVASLLVSISAGNHLLDEIGEPRIEALVQPQAVNPGVANPGGGQDVPDAGVPDEDKMDALWALVLASYYPTAGVISYDALTNTGKLGIIKNPDLIRDLQNYRQKWIGLDETHAGTMRPLRNEAVGVGHRYGLSPLTASPKEELLRKLKEHEELRATIRTQIAYKTLHYRLLIELDRAAAEILAALERKGARQ